MKKDKLVLGCGKNYHGDSWEHLDISDLNHVDKLHDLNKGFLPYEDNRFKKLKAIHVLEHLKKDALKSILYEINRVCKTGAEIIIALPYYLSRHSADLDHNILGSEKTFVQFTESYEMNTPYDPLFKLNNISYDFKDCWTVRIGIVLISSKILAQRIPNTCEEIRFYMKNREIDHSRAEKR